MDLPRADVDWILKSAPSRPCLQVHSLGRRVVQKSKGGPNPIEAPVPSTRVILGSVPRWRGLQVQFPRSVRQEVAQEMEMGAAPIH
jgi:hypothetical protein